SLIRYCSPWLTVGLTAAGPAARRTCYRHLGAGLEVRHTGGCGQNARYALRDGAKLAGIIRIRCVATAPQTGGEGVYVTARVQCARVARVALQQRHIILEALTRGR